MGGRSVPIAASPDSCGGTRYAGSRRILRETPRCRTSALHTQSEDFRQFARSRQKYTGASIGTVCSDARTPRTSVVHHDSDGAGKYSGDATEPKVAGVATVKYTGDG